MAAYIALIRKENGSDFGVNFPDFPGCMTAGRTLEEARVVLLLEPKTTLNPGNLQNERTVRQLDTL